MNGIVRLKTQLSLGHPCCDKSQCPQQNAPLLFEARCEDMGT